MRAVNLLPRESATAANARPRPRASCAGVAVTVLVAAIRRRRLLPREGARRRRSGSGSRRRRPQLVRSAEPAADRAPAGAAQLPTPVVLSQAAALAHRARHRALDARRLGRRCSSSSSTSCPTSVTLTSVTARRQRALRPARSSGTITLGGSAFSSNDVAQSSSRRSRASRRSRRSRSSAPRQTEATERPDLPDHGADEPSRPASRRRPYHDTTTTTGGQRMTLSTARSASLRPSSVSTSCSSWSAGCALVAPQRHDAASGCGAGAARADAARQRSVRRARRRISKQPADPHVGIYTLDTALPAQADQPDLLFELDRLATGVRRQGHSASRRRRRRPTASGYTVAADHSEPHRVATSGDPVPRAASGRSSPTTTGA